jgi:hypothetical protein
MAGLGNNKQLCGGANTISVYKKDSTPFARSEATVTEKEDEAGDDKSVVHGLSGGSRLMHMRPGAPKMVVAGVD